MAYYLIKTRPRIHNTPVISGFPVLPKDTNQFFVVVCQSRIHHL